MVIASSKRRISDVGSTRKPAVSSRRGVGIPQFEFELDKCLFLLFLVRVTVIWLVGGGWCSESTRVFGVFFLATTTKTRRDRH